MQIVGVESLSCCLGDMIDTASRIVNAPSRSSRACSFVRSRVTRLSGRFASRPFLYGSAFMLPIGMNLYEQIHPRLAKEYAHIVDRYDSNGTIIYVLALNVVIFLVWQVAHIGATSQRALPALRNLLPFMKRHFLMDPQVALKPSRWHTCLTSMFSHQHAWHIVANSMVLVSFGGIVHQAVGRELWLLIYIGKSFQHIFGGCCVVFGLLDCIGCFVAKPIRFRATSHGSQCAGAYELSFMPFKFASRYIVREAGWQTLFVLVKRTHSVRKVKIKVLSAFPDQ